MDRCVDCGRHDDGSGAVTIRLCSVCKTVGYCSRECQKRHWPSHKKECAKPETGKAGTKECSGQKGEGEQSKMMAEGKTTTTRPDLDGNQGDGAKMACHKCGLQREAMKQCSSCHGVMYCSRDCQRADWKTHKPVCGAVLNKTTTVATMDHRPKKDSPFPRKAPGVSSSPAISWEEARRRAAERFPGHRIVDKFPDLVPDIMGVVVRGVVAVLKIGVVYPHFFRHGRCLEDAEGNTSFILFHTPQDPRPYFRYAQLREGNFLCYQHAHMHFFVDGTVGLRIDDPREVHILEPLKQKTLPSITASSGEFASSLSHSPDPSPPSSSPSSTEDSWRRAREQAAAMFPGVDVVDRLQDINHGDLTQYTKNLLCTTTNPDQPFNIVCRDPSGTSLEIGDEVGVTVVMQLVLLASCPAFRYIWIVKDRQGTAMQVKFKGSTNQVWPYVRFEDLRKGHFLCISHPQITICKEEFQSYIITANNPRRAAAFSL